MVEQEDADPVFDHVRDVVAGDPSMSLEEVADEAGLPLQILREVFEAMHWADRPGYDERDVSYAATIADILDHYSLGAVIRSLRTRYRSLTSVVISDLGTVRDEITRPALARGADADELGERVAGTAREILPRITAQLAEDYRHILLRLLDSDALERGVQSVEGREVELAIAFVDVVGFTALSGHLDPAGLEHVLRSFEDLVTAAAADTEEVLLVKFVGDAAMLVSPDPLELTSLLVDLVTGEQRVAEAPRRAGVAWGQVLVREGDYYGPVPNLAARLTDHAHQWSLLAAEEMQELLEEEFALTEIPEISIPGIGERRPFRVRRDDDGEE